MKQIFVLCLLLSSFVISGDGFSADTKVYLAGGAAEGIPADTLNMGLAARDNGDHRKALQLFLEVANNQSGDGEALRGAAFNIASMIWESFGVEKSEELWVCFMETAANNGHARAQWWLAYFTLKQPGKHDETISWARRSAEQGDVAARWRMAEYADRYSEVPLSEKYKQYILFVNAGDEEFSKVLERDRNKPDPEIQEAIREGEKLAADWKPIIEPIPNPPVAVPEDCIVKLREEISR